MKSRRYECVTFNLPLPPEAAALGDPSFRSWLAAAGAEIAQAQAGRIPGAVALKTFVAVGEPRDLENVAGRLIDILVVHGVIGENCIADLALRFDRTIEAGRVRVEVKRVKPPQARLGAAARANVAQAARTRWLNYRATHCEQVRYGKRASNWMVKYR